MMIWVFLIFSVLLNVLFVWYSKTVVKKLWFVSENIGGLLSNLEEYRGHLELINSMETYNGDVVVENLIRHTKNLVQQVSTYREIYTITHGDQEEPETEKENG